MDWVTENFVGLAAIALGVLVIVGITVAVVRGIRLYRTAMWAQGIAAEHVAVISAEAARAQATMDRVNENQAILQANLESLAAQLALAKALASHASDAIAVLRAPLRYLGR